MEQTQFSFVKLDIKSVFLRDIAALEEVKVWFFFSTATKVTEI